MTVFYLQGVDAKVTVNGSPYGIASCTVKDMTPSADSSNSEGYSNNPLPAREGFSTSLPLLSRVVVEVHNPSFDSLNNPFSAPYDLHSGETINLQIDPVITLGIGYSFPALLITEIDYTVDATKLQPVGFTGESVGAYFDPGQG